MSEKESNMSEHDVCGYIRAWGAPCQGPPIKGGTRCEAHSNMVCISCGEPATHACDETGEFLCAFPLCDNCVHATFPDGTNGGVGFNAQKLPDNLRKRHIKKTEQVYSPWYTHD